MKADEIVKALREIADWLDKECFSGMRDDCRSSADLIESQDAQIKELTAQLAASQRRERAAVEDLRTVHKKIMGCFACRWDAVDWGEACNVCAGCMANNGDNWEYRGLQGEGEDENA